LSFVRVVALALVLAACCRATFLFAQSDDAGDSILIGIFIVSNPDEDEETSASAEVLEAPPLPAPGLRVLTVRVPRIAGNVAAQDVLDGLEINVGDGTRRPVKRRFTWIARGGASHATTVTVTRRGSPDVPLAQTTVPVSDRQSGSQQDTATHDITMPPIATRGGVCVIHGDTSGDSRAMSIAVDGTAAAVLAAKPGAVFWRVPGDIAPGRHLVVFVAGPGRQPVAIEFFVVVLDLSADLTDLLRGQSTRFLARIIGLETLSESAWQAGLPPSDLFDLDTLASDGKTLHNGEVLLVLENQSSRVVRIKGAGRRVIVHLRRKDCEKGAPTYEGVLQSLQSGGFVIVGYVVPLLKPVVFRPVI
jgi:hypothetical protein